VNISLHDASERVEQLLERFSALPATTGARADAEELVRVLSGLYGEALRKIVEGIQASLGEQQANALLERCCDDPLVATLLVTHGLHPVPLKMRVERALGSVEPYLRRHEAAAEIVRADEDVVEVRVNGSADVIPKIEHAIREAAPEVLDVRATGQTISLLEAR
jgi:Fe-S cluster biogenesis protein NfuA